MLIELKSISTIWSPRSWCVICFSNRSYPNILLLIAGGTVLDSLAVQGKKHRTAPNPPITHNPLHTLYWSPWGSQCFQNFWNLRYILGGENSQLSISVCLADCHVATACSRLLRFKLNSFCMHIFATGNINKLGSLKGGFLSESQLTD